MKYINLRILLVFLFAMATGVILGQKGGVTGTIVDEKNEPLIGANVIIENTKIGAVTDFNGKYTINNIDPGKYKLVISSIGYKKQIVPVEVSSGKTAKVDLGMKEDILQLDQVVVVGYGTKQKRDITGSIESLKAKDIMEQSGSSFENAMQGRASGVQITAANGVAGAPVKINIRGIGSISAGSDPLYVIDGIPMITGDYSSGSSGTGMNALSDINPNDIETMEILKDAASSAIYGSRGANGVVLITTKKGKSGKTKFNASYTSGVVKETNRLKFLSASEHLALRDQWKTETGQVADNPSTPIFGTWTRKQADSLAAKGGTDWIDQVLQLGNTNDVNLSATGGGEKTTFYIGGSYHNENGFLKGNSFQRISGRLNVDNKATEKLSLGANMNITYSNNVRVPVGDAGGLGDAQRMLPYIPVRNADGSYFYISKDGYPTNPLWELETKKFKTNSLRSLSSIFGEYEFLPELKLRSEFGFDLMSQVEDEFQFRNIQKTDDVSSAWNRRTFALTWTSSSFLTYTKQFNEIHDVTLTAGSEFQSSHTDGVGLRGWNFPADYFTTPDGASQKEGYYYETGNGFVSNFFRGNYKLLNKYLATFSVRYDASSKFGKDYQYGLFPSGSLGWIISDEAFLKDNKVLSLLKVHTSLGLTGNSNIQDFEYIGYYSPSSGYNGNPAIYPAALPNSNLHWEKSTAYDATIEYGFFNNRLSGSVSYYYKYIHDMLMNVSLPTSAGYSLIRKNVGVMTNDGLEFSILSRNINKKYFKWTTDFNIAFNRNKVIDAAGLPPDAFESGQAGEGRVLAGYPVGQAFVVRYAGVSQTDQTITNYDLNGNVINTDQVKAGEALYYDKNGNLMTTSNPFFYDNRVPRGNPLPIFSGGITNTFTYKNFDFSFLFSFVYGNTLYDDPAKLQIGDFQHIAQREEMLDTWSASNPSDVPSLKYTEASWNSDRFLYDASFIRLRSISFGYKLSSEVCQKIKVSSLRVYVSGTNLLTFTKYPGWDPEALRNVNTGKQEGNISFAGPSLQTPQARTLTAGIQVEF